MQSCSFIDPDFKAIVVPEHTEHVRLSLRGWNDRLSHSVHGCNPVGEKEPAGHGTENNGQLNIKVFTTKY